MVFYNAGSGCALRSTLRSNKNRWTTSKCSSKFEMTVTSNNVFDVCANPGDFFFSNEKSKKDNPASPFPQTHPEPTTAAHLPEHVLPAYQAGVQMSSFSGSSSSGGGSPRWVKGKASSDVLPLVFFYPCLCARVYTDTTVNRTIRL